MLQDLRAFQRGCRDDCGADALEWNVADIPQVPFLRFCRPAIRRLVRVRFLGVSDRACRLLYGSCRQMRVSVNYINGVVR